MNASRFRFCCSLFASFVVACFTTSASAQTSTLSVTFSVADLPTSITLCRDTNAIAAFGVDEEWLIAIDIDDNAGTGDPATGVEVILLASTLPQTPPCTPTPANTQQSIVSGMYVWDQAQQTYVQSSQAVIPGLDFNANTLTLSTSVTGPLDSFSALSRIYFLTQASYTPGNGNPTTAYDSAESVHAGGAGTDPANDVQACESPCTTGAPWYRLIDLVGISASTTEALPAFGANTIYLEFQMANLTEMIDLCLYPGLFANPSSEWSWFLWSNLDADPGTGEPSSGIDSVVTVSTQPPLPGCVPYSLDLQQSLSVNLYRYDSTLGDYAQVAIGTWPVSVDLSSDKIIVQADRRVSPLSSLSTASLNYMQSWRLYWPHPTQPDDPYATDVVSGITMGGVFPDALGDVLNCSLGCSTSASWYPTIDFVSGSLHLQDSIFRSTFE